MCSPAKGVWGVEPHRGFESLRFRQVLINQRVTNVLTSQIAPAAGLFFCLIFKIRAQSVHLP